MSIQVWSFGLQKLTKMIENHVHIRSTDHFKQVGVRGKMTEMTSIVWMSDLCPLNLIFVSSFSLFIGCGSIFARVLPNMPQASLSGFRL